MGRTRSLWLVLGAVVGAAAAVPANAAGLPTSPARVQAFPGTGAVLVTFTSAQNATGYNVYRRAHGEAADKAVKVNAQPTPFTWLIDDGGGAGLPNGAPLLYFVKAVLQDGTEGAASKEVVVTPQVPVLGSFYAHDIGTTDPSSVTLENNVLTIKAGGSELWDTTDEGTFVGTAIAGDYQITAKVLEKPAGGHARSAKAGVMVREELTPGARYAFAMLTSGRGTFFEGNKGTLGALPDGSQAWFAHGEDVDAEVVPVWVRLVKKGAIFSAFQSTDGTTFEALGEEEDFGRIQPVTYVGLGVSAVSTGDPKLRPVTAKFDATSIKIE
jgi:hypothetical protein